MWHVCVSVHHCLPLCLLSHPLIPPFSLCSEHLEGEEHPHEDEVLLLYKSHQRTLVPPDVLRACSSLLPAAFSPLWSQLQGDLWLLLSLKKILHKPARLSEAAWWKHYPEWSAELQSCCCHVGSRPVPGLEGGRSSELCPQLLLLCPACSTEVKLSLHCAAFHTSELTGFWRDGQTRSCTEFSEVDMKSKAQLCWSLIMQLRSPEFLFPKWYAVTVSRLTLRKCMCLVSEKLPDRNHKYLRWSGRNGLLKPWAAELWYQGFENCILFLWSCFQEPWHFTVCVWCVELRTL